MILRPAITTAGCYDAAPRCSCWGPCRPSHGHAAHLEARECPKERGRRSAQSGTRGELRYRTTSPLDCVARLADHLAARILAAYNDGTFTTEDFQHPRIELIGEVAQALRDGSGSAAPHRAPDGRGGGADADLKDQRLPGRLIRAARRASRGRREKTWNLRLSAACLPVYGSPDIRQKPG